MKASSNRVENSCNYCATKFSVKWSHRGQKFCTKPCMTSYEAVHGRKAAQVAATELTCRECGNAFSIKPAAARSYVKKFGKDQPYCSIACSSLGRRKDTMERQQFTCLQCGKTQSRRRKPGGRVYLQQKFCDATCKVLHQSTRALERFERGDYGKHEKRNGYMWITIPMLGRTGRKHIMEHRHVMSKKLGRDLLPEETVHHVNGIRSDNREENLELFNSRHGPGQRVVDKVDFAIEILTTYPAFAKAAAGWKNLVEVVHAATDDLPSTA